MNDLLQRVRSLPLYQRYLIVWAGSLIIFLAVSWVKVHQIKTQLASLTAPTFLIAQEKTEEEPSLSAATRLQNFFDDTGKTIAALFSLGKEEKEEEAEHPPQKGQKTNQLLDQRGYEPFPE